MSKKIACDHCHLVFDEGVMLTQGVDTTLRHFCCKGCQGVYNLLQDEGLGHFYERTQTLTPQTKKFLDSAQFDTPSFREMFVTTKPNGLQEIALIIEGIHCAACVWLNEKVLYETQGIIEASINFSTHKAKISWDPAVIALSRIIDIIRSIGYDAYAYDPKSSETPTNTLKKSFHMRLIVGVFASMNIMWVAVAQYAGFFTGMNENVRMILSIAQFLLATPVLFYSGFVFFKSAYYGLKNNFVNMDLLVATGAMLTYGYSIYLMLFTTHEPYFDSVAMIITFVLFGKYLEVASKKSASEVLDKLNKHIPLQVRKITPQGIATTTIHDINVDDFIEVLAGDRIAFDGVITQGEAYIDTATLTGESEPVAKTVGDVLQSGTTCLNARIVMRVEKRYEQSTFAKLLHVLEEALNKKPLIEQLANRLSGMFSNIVLLLALATFAVWWGFVSDFDTAFMVGISVIIIACPCALALATPIASLVGVSLGAKKGVLFKEAKFLETLALAQKVFLDKTGTLTQGKPHIVQEQIFAGFDPLEVARLLETSTHPISQAVRTTLPAIVEHTHFDSHEIVLARGIKATHHADFFCAGNAEFLRQEGVEIDALTTSYIHFYIAKNGKLIAHYELEDPIREGAGALVTYLKSRNIDVVMLTGDHDASARRVAEMVGIDHVYSALTPLEKSQIIARHKKATCVMVGDGMNDTVALATADIGISMGAGASVAIDTSDIVLLHDDIQSLQAAFKISKNSYALIKQNLVISLVYNAITIPLAMAGWIIPLFAALSMSFSSLLVVANSLRVQWMKG